MTPFEPARYSACDCQEASLIGPGTPLIVAVALVKVTLPKSGTYAMFLPTVGASTTHSALLNWAVGLW